MSSAIEYRRWVSDEGGENGRFVPVVGAVPCAFDGFTDLQVEGFGEVGFFSHLWGEGRFAVAEALTGYGIDGDSDGRESNTYARRGEAIDAAEMELHRIGAGLFGATVRDVLARRNDGL